jgi:Uma2 family endonuclease
MSIVARTMTAEELLRMPEDGYRYELVEGELHQMAPPGFLHGMIGNDLSWRLAQYVQANGLGVVLAAETGFILGRNPDTVRAPDIAFVSKSQLDRCGLPEGYFPEAPALAVEVVSPSDTAEEVDSKVRSWLTAGTQLAWVVYPGGRSITVYRSLDDIHVLTEKDKLIGNSVVPGFECDVADLFVGIK